MNYFSNKSFKNFSDNKFLLISFPYMLLFIFLTLLVRNNPFFWDTIHLASKQANWFYDNNFNKFLLPDDFDSGHFPLFGFTLAVFWKIFGRSLLVSHFMMLPFLLLIVWQTIKLLKYFLSENIFILLSAGVIFLNPVFLGQASLVSPDIVLFFFFIFSLNNILYNNRKLLIISLLGLSLISLRGLMCVVILFIFDVFRYIFENKKVIFKVLFFRGLFYFLICIPVISFLIYHYFKKGWIGYHSASPWAQCFILQGFKGIMFNIIIIAWRLIDFGNVFVLILLFIFIKKIFYNNNSTILSILLITSLVILLPTMLIYKNLTMHRYLLPIYFSISLLVTYLLFEISKTDKLKKIIVATILIIGLVSGNFWIYPDKISQGWDATLAHLPYYKLRKEMFDFIKFNKIDFAQVGAYFPMADENKYIDLIDDKIKIEPFSSEKHKFVIYSNIFNDVSDNEIDIFFKDYKIIKYSERYGVKMILFKVN